jgi:hypothetical protein
MMWRVQKEEWRELENDSQMSLKGGSGNHCIQRVRRTVNAWLPLPRTHNQTVVRTHTHTDEARTHTHTLPCDSLHPLHKAFLTFWIPVIYALIQDNLQ